MVFSMLFKARRARLTRVAVLKSVREKPHPVGAFRHRTFSVVLPTFTISKIPFCDTRFRGFVCEDADGLGRIPSLPTAHNKLSLSQPRQPPLNLIWHLQGESTLMARRS